MTNFETPSQNNAPDQASIDSLVSDYKAKGWIQEDTSMVAIVGAAGSLKKTGDTWTVTNLDKPAFDAAVNAMKEADKNRQALQAEVSPVVVDTGNVTEMFEAVQTPLAKTETVVVQEGSFADMMQAADTMHEDASNFNVDAITVQPGDSVSKILANAGVESPKIQALVDSYGLAANVINPGDTVRVVNGTLKITAKDSSGPENSEIVNQTSMKPSNSEGDFRNIDDALDMALKAKKERNQR